MSKVLVTRSKLDGLATTIAAKSGATLPLTIAQMDAAVDGIETGVDTSHDTVDAAHLLDGYTAHDANGDAITGEYVPASPTLETVTKSYTPSETQQTETITPSTGYDGIAEVDVTVGAVSSTYVGSGVTRRSSVDLTASGATVNVPAGYYASAASKSVASGTEGTPTATKGSVSNHSVSVTPSVTNAAGYISGGTLTGTAVSVSASELVSGTLAITGSGTHDVTDYASASVAAGGATASATKGTVSNHSVTVTPSVTRTAGYVTAGSSNGTAVTVSASELVSGTYTVDSSGTKDVTNYASASVAAGSATASATKGSVSNHSVSVTPSVTRTAGWVSAGTASGTAVTVSASELVSGSETKTENGTYDVTNLASLIVDVDGYTLTTVCPQQTITPNSDRIAYPVGSFDYEVGEFYLVTFDGVEYVTSCALCWETNHVIGDTRVIWGDAVAVTPFCAITTSVTDKEVYCRDTNTHTIKVEHLELGTPAATLTTKSITSNGTYSASSDNADGYSSVTVNVPSGGGTYQAKTNISPTTSSQTITPDSGYDALSSVQINAMPTGTAGTPTATKGTVSNHSVSVTPSVTNTTGYITGGTKTGTAVTVSASELVSGNKSITANGNNIDVTDYATVSVNVSGGSSKNVQVAQSTSRATSTTYTSVCSLTCSTAGTYDIYWDCFRSSTGGTNGSQLYIGGSSYGTANTTFTNHAQTNHLTGVTLAKNQTVAVYARSRGSNYYAYCGQLTIVQTA